MNFVVHQFPPECTYNHHGYDEVNKCIYCPRTDLYLTKEHIIGKGLNGTLTLKKASCKTCQKVTAGIENFCFGHMRYFRLKNKFRSSRKPPFKVQARYKDEPPGIIEMVRNELPGGLVIPMVPPPTKFFGPWSSSAAGSAFQFFSDMKWPKDTVFSIGPFDLNTYCRMIAKIAHCYACAVIGVDNFQHLLPKIILNADEDPFEFIGCLSQHVPLPKEECLHRLSFECWEQAGILYLVVKVRLLAYIGAPEYHAVVGTVSAIPKAAMTRVFWSKMPSTHIDH